MWETWFDPWVGKIPGRRERLPTPVFWPREFHGLYSPWGRKKSDTTEWLSLSPLNPDLFLTPVESWDPNFMWLWVWGSPQKSAKLVRKTWRSATTKTQLLFCPFVAFALWGCGLCSGESLGMQTRPPLAHPLALILTSFLEECSPSLAADAQDQEAENDAHGELHPAAER